jgi:hypothetical protein
MANQSIPFSGYPAPGAESTRIQWKGDHWGAANYQQGGYNLNASALGMSNIEVAATSKLSQSGNYYANVLYPANSGNNELRAIPPTYVTVKWYYAANSVEVANNTNLSAEVSLLTASGI